MKKAAPELSQAERTCLTKPKLRSTEPVPVRDTKFTLTNESKETVVAYWLDYKGKRQQYFEPAPNQKTEQFAHSGLCACALKFVLPEPVMGVYIASSTTA